MLLTCIRELSGSNLSCDTSHSELVCGVPQFQCKSTRWRMQLVPRLFSHCFPPFFPLSSNYSTLQGLRIWQRRYINFISLTQMSTRNFPGDNVSRRVKLKTSQPSVSRFSRQCGILNISQPYRPPRPVMGIFFLHEDPIYLQAVIIHSANGGKG
jgi:hypothetical protein